jgi:diguanylate cyclase (GGDEF)-like protein
LVFEDKKILVVDDSETFLAFIHSLLSNTGALVDVAKTGKEGLKRHTDKSSYDLILLDLRLPDMNGLQVLEQIRLKDDYSTIVMLTGEGDVKTALAAIRKGSDGYTEKQDLVEKNEMDAFLMVLEQAMQYRAGITAQKGMQDKLKYMSLHDTLTGLYNRAYFEEEIARLERGRRYPVSVIIIDVNRLKQANDEYGHSAGDELLQCTAEVLRRTFRAEDAIARIGGDEFAILLAGCDAETAQNMIVRVQEQISAVNQTRNQIPLSLAIGAATAHKPGSLSTALRQADKAMYKHKALQKKGRITG